MKLTEHFSLEEAIRTNLLPNYKIKPDQIQIEMHRMVAELVEILFRGPLGTPIIISSGQRDRGIYMAMIANGYSPADRSDHFFGAEINGWHWTCGAWDMIFKDREEETGEIYHRAYSLLWNDLKFLLKGVGQMIYYPMQTGRSAFIHLSNSPEVIYGGRIAGALRKLNPNRQQFLIRTAGGYKKYAG